MPHGVASIALLTLQEARRRKLVLAAFIGALAFIAVVALGLYFTGATSIFESLPLAQRVQSAMTTTVALHAAHFFIVLITVVLALDTVSGEIESGVMQAIASKPIFRWEVLLGKWIAYFIVSAGFALLLIGGVLTLAVAMSGYRPPDLTLGFVMVLLEIAFFLSIVIAGGTLFGTIVNGIFAFSFFAIAFVGGWIEMVGIFAESPGARHVGIVLSLISPGDAIWRLAAFHLQPGLTRYIPGTPFTSPALANQWMVVWTIAYSVLAMALGNRAFARRSI
jgi:Cu-processing system permease protein